MPLQLESQKDDSLQPFSYPERAAMQPMRFGANLTVAKGQAIAKHASTKVGILYDDAGSGGAVTCVGISRYAFKTDANGKCYMGESAIGDSRIPTSDTMPVYIHGNFDPTKLTGYDAAALVDLDGRTLPDGSIEF